MHYFRIFFDDGSHLDEHAQSADQATTAALLRTWAAGRTNAKVVNIILLR